MVTCLNIHDLEDLISFHYYFIVNRVVMSGLKVSVTSCEAKYPTKSSYYKLVKLLDFHYIRKSFQFTQNKTIYYDLHLKSLWTGLIATQFLNLFVYLN